MEFFDVIHNRSSVRVFDHSEVDSKTLDLILETMNRAPSAGDLQAYEVVVVRDPERRRMLSDAAGGQDSLREAPVVLVFVTDPALSEETYGDRGDLFCFQDATIAASHAQLAAQALGLGSVWVGEFDESAVRDVVDAPAPHLPVCLLAIGHPAEEPIPTPRRELRDLVRWESYEAAMKSV